MTRTIADFAPFVELAFGAAAPATIQHAVRQSVVAFMRETRAVADIVYLRGGCGQVEYVLDIPDCRRLVGVEQLWRAPPGETLWTPAWREVIANDFGGGGTGWELSDLGGPNLTLWVYPTPSSAVTYAVRYAWAIGRDDCAVPDWVYEEYEPTITAGALALLHHNPQDQTADAKFAATNERRFAAGVAEARTRRYAQYRARRAPVSVGSFFRG